MNKQKSLRKLNRNTDERKRLFKGLIRSFAQKGKLETSVTKAKAVRPLVEKLVTEAKKNTLSSFRRLIADTSDVNTAYHLQKAGVVFKNRPGGYTRIIRLGSRSGDNTEKVRMEWVEQVQLTTWPVKKEKIKTEVNKKEKPEKVDKTKKEVKTEKKEIKKQSTKEKK
jgi:large subunit ribosomal protein L17